MGTCSNLSRFVTVFCALQMVIFVKEGHGLISGSGVTGTVGKRMVKSLHCFQQVLEAAGRYSSLGVRSRLECVARCRQDDRCKSITYDGHSSTCHLGLAKAEDDCSNMEPPAHGKVAFYQEVTCGKRGQMGPLGLCVCIKGFTGVPCKRYHHDCTDVQRYNPNWNTTSNEGKYTVSPLKAEAPFEVYCRKMTYVRTYIMDRRRTTENFTRPWLDYRNGFGVVQKGVDYWLGLEKIYALTAERKQRLLVNIKRYKSNNNPVIVGYNNFRLSDEASGYRIYFNDTELNNTDCLKRLLGVKFSTYDHDRDGNSSVNCAERFKGGFWFKDSGCARCNPNGVMYQGGDRDYKRGEAFWKSALGDEPVWKISMYMIPIED